MFRCDTFYLKLGHTFKTTKSDYKDIVSSVTSLCVKGMCGRRTGCSLITYTVRAHKLAKQWAQDRRKLVSLYVVFSSLHDLPTIRLLGTIDMIDAAFGHLNPISIKATGK